MIAALSPAPACNGCGAVAVELNDGYCDETLACHAAAVELQLEREYDVARCRDEYLLLGCWCGTHMEVR